MKNLILIIILTIAGRGAQAQPIRLDSSVIVYTFKGFSIVLLNESISDSLLNQPVAPASTTRPIIATDGMLSVFLSTNEEPLAHAAKKIMMDTGSNEPVAIEDIETRSGFVERNSYTEWKDVKASWLLNMDTSYPMWPRVPVNLPLAKGDYYIPFQFSVGPYDTRIISIRNKKTKDELINFRIRVVDKPVIPLLIQVAKDKATEKLVDSILQNFPKGKTNHYLEVRRIGYPKGAEVTETPLVLNNENLNEISTLILYFRKLSLHYPDSSLQYRLSSEADKDTSWTKTGHKLVIPDLDAGTHYQLEVRYELHPEYIQRHSFYTAARWYQTSLTKSIIAGILIAGALLTGLLVYKQRLNKSRRRREALSLEIKSIRSQLNPHFIFNALASIQGLINKNDVPAANRYLSEFSTLLRESLHNNEKEMVPLVTEVKLLETYLKLEQLRFNFKYAIEIDEALNKNTTEIPNLMLQPLVENAVKHGVSTLGENGFVAIDFTKREKDLIVSIIDNGNKFDATQTSEGFGLRLTRNRISLLSQTLKEQPIKLSIERREDRQTVINLIFTNWL